VGADPDSLVAIELHFLDGTLWLQSKEAAGKTGTRRCGAERDNPEPCPPERFVRRGLELGGHEAQERTAHREFVTAPSGEAVVISAAPQQPKAFETANDSEH
jgi:hypothetical protein